MSRVENRHRAGAECWSVGRLAIVRKDHAEGKGKTELNLRSVARRSAVVNVRVEMHGCHRRASLHAEVDDGDATLSDVPVDFGFETLEVVGVQVRHVHLTRHGVNRDVEQNRPHAGRHVDFDRRVLRGIEYEEIPVRQIEPHARRPVASRDIAPRRAIVLDDDASLGRLFAGRVGQIRWQRRHSKRRESVVERNVQIESTDRDVDHVVRDDEVVEHRSLIARVKSSRVHASAVRARGETTGSVRKERHDLRGGREVVDLKHPDVGTTHALRGELRISRSILSTTRGRDKRLLVIASGKDDVTRFITDPERRLDKGPGGIGDINDRDAIREVIHDPEFAVACGECDRLEADHDVTCAGQTFLGDRENLDAVVGRVRREEEAVVG